MEPNDHIKAKIAKALLSQNDPGKRRRLILIHVAVLLVLFFTHSYFSNLTSPLKLIPQTISAMGMGFVMVHILSLRRFGSIAVFIDWPKVKNSAQQTAP